ncbi:MAG: hypothetical protein GW761_11650 [Leptospira sp.]|nr:hypothetical protein [Leptospira sp.]
MLHCAPPQKSLEEKLTQGGVEAAAFWVFIFPTLDFNQYCPPTDQIPILEPGNHNIFLSEGQSYFFDNKARFDAFSSISDKSFHEFTFIFQENTAQDVRLVVPNCGQSSGSRPSSNDSGKPGQLETVQNDLDNPFRSGRRGAFIELTSIRGFGSIILTSPSKPNPPN